MIVDEIAQCAGVANWYLVKKNLYSSQSNVSRNDDLSMFLRDPNISRLSEEQKASCEGRISKEECKQALESFDPGKTPGNDGLPVEFYKTFWASLDDYLTDVFNSSFEYEEMSNSQKQAIITLLDKKGRDRTYLENWRPISLINVDAKIASKAIANRMKKVLPGIIHHDQSGFIKNRFIGETARSIIDIMQHMDAQKMPGLLLFIDFEKAFDSVEWDYLTASLKAFNFGPEFIKWVKTFYKNVSSCILNNGFFSESFLLERGVRQGDPLSPYLFVAAVEILAIAIRSDSNIRGVKVGDEETKILAYADDMTATLSDISSLERLLAVLNAFERCSGLKMNFKKTKAMWIGANKGSSAKPLHLDWVTGVKNLGIYFSCQREEVTVHNFEERLNQIQKTINLWSMRGLSLFGKVTIIKTFLIPKLLYVSSIIETPYDILRRMERMIYKFLWKGPDKVTRNSVINKLEQGGLNLTDIETQIKALRLSWIPRILDERKGAWKSYFNFQLKNHGGVFLLSCNYDVKDLNLNLTGFYAELLIWWADFRMSFFDMSRAENIIWNNKEIKINNKPVFYANYYSLGITCLRDLLFEYDNVASYECFKRKGLHTNFLAWTALRTSVPRSLKAEVLMDEFDPMVLQDAHKVFDIKSAKSKQFYKLLLSKKAKLPNMSRRLIADFDVEDMLEKIYFLPHNVASETYVLSFQYRLLNYILFTNAKLFKIGLLLTDQCTFCNVNDETLYHLFFECSHVQAFWECFVEWWTVVANENLSLTLKDVILGFPERNDILNYLLILSKLCIWECRRSNRCLNFNLFLYKIEVKKETERYIAVKNGTLEEFNRKWGLFQH